MFFVTINMTRYLDERGHKGTVGLKKTNLLEFLNIDVELGTELGFGVGERGDLVGEGAAASCFGVGAAALDFVLCGEMGDFGVFVPEDGLEVHFAEFGLVGEDFASGFESIRSLVGSVETW